MKNKKILIRQILITCVCIICLFGFASFCYTSVEKMIISKEEENMKSLAKVNARSLFSTLESKKNLVYAAFSGDMENLDEVESGIIKMGERCKYVPLEEIRKQTQWEQKQCAEILKNPGEVVVGPIEPAEKQGYVLYMMKTISVKGKITGYVRVQLDLDEIYEEEQALSALKTENGRYCIVQNEAGETIMPGAYEKEDISIVHATGKDSTVKWIYEANGGSLKNTKKLIACETITVGEERLFLYIVENYNELINPLERISLYFSLIGVLLVVIAIGFIYKLQEQHKKETQLVKELQHEKTLNEIMRKQEGLMKKYNHSKNLGVLTGAIAHEFNNLMTPIVLYAELLEENESVQKEMSDEVHELKTSAVRCGELARQLLDYSRQGKAEKVLTDYDAVYAMHEAINIVKKILPENIVLQERICKTPYKIHGQVGSLNQIVLNLATNAVHAMKKGGVLKIEFGLSIEDDQFVRLIVADTGEGIPSEIRQKVFQPFFTTKKGNEGTGIGLTVVKRLIEEHGGVIRVKTEIGKGTVFIVDFPYVTE